jgi:hypothetical protein
MIVRTWVSVKQKYVYFEFRFRIHKIDYIGQRVDRKWFTHSRGLQMVELRCNSCLSLSNDFCAKLKVILPNGRAKLYYGGAVGVYYGNVTYPSKCGIKEEVKGKQKLDVIVPSPDQEIPEQYQQP